MSTITKSADWLADLQAKLQESGLPGRVSSGAQAAAQRAQGLGQRALSAGQPYVQKARDLAGGIPERLAAAGIDAGAQRALLSGLLAAAAAGGGSALVNRMSPRDGNGERAPVLSPMTMALLAGLGVGGASYASNRFGNVAPSELPPVKQGPVDAALSGAQTAIAGNGPVLAATAAGAGALSAIPGQLRNNNGYAGLGSLDRELGRRKQVLTPLTGAPLEAAREALRMERTALRTDVTKGLKGLFYAPDAAARRAAAGQTVRAGKAFFTGAPSSPAIHALNTAGNPRLTNLARGLSGRNIGGLIPRMLTRGGLAAAGTALLPSLLSTLRGQGVEGQ